ncbi:hypothetical protein IVB18_40750 [Bradyrhizobium sp. 186]|uniref:hypothetical protein n=1 Tax=Bradyrhizobium sp. 186 TaxID=2782654 RepID=UPI002000B4FF|nr:hypothetical protein [Bradyrhizobium sp. 186]UPK34385.1 hypothetical protein IVB18_40750 [Bradyrhizobium sp. 186]
MKSAYLLRFASGARRHTVGCWAKMSPKELLLAVRVFNARQVFITGGKLALHEPAAADDTAYHLKLLSTVGNIGHHRHSSASLHMGNGQPKIGTARRVNGFGKSDSRSLVAQELQFRNYD